MATTTMRKLSDPVRAKEFFGAEVEFTTGPIELNRIRQEAPQSINIIDVREAEDYQKGHVPGAKNLPKDRWDTLEGLSKDRENIVYCYSIVCHLAKKAALEFADKGYPVMELEGGFDEWQSHGLEVEK